MKIALIVTHNKSDSENFNQIEALKPLIEKIQDTNYEYDEEGKVKGTFYTYHYQIKGLLLEHEAKFYQILPFGVKQPSNFYEIDSHNVLYRKGDEDKTGDHPRFFNWGLKRGTDYGADIVIYLEDYKKFNVEDLPFYLSSLIDPTDKTEYAEDESMKISTLNVLKEIGQIDESRSKEEGLMIYKEKILKKGLRYG